LSKCFPEASETMISTLAANPRLQAYSMLSTTVEYFVPLIHVFHGKYLVAMTIYNGVSFTTVLGFISSRRYYGDRCSPTTFVYIISTINSSFSILYVCPQFLQNSLPFSSGKGLGVNLPNPEL